MHEWMESVKAISVRVRMIMCDEHERHREETTAATAHNYKVAHWLQEHSHYSFYRVFARTTRSTVISPDEDCGYVRQPF